MAIMWTASFGWFKGTTSLVVLQPIKFRFMIRCMQIIFAAWDDVLRQNPESTLSVPLSVKKSRFDQLSS